MRYVCLLRGVNVSGYRKLSMKDLLTMVQELGCMNAVSYLQSGNIVLDSSLSADLLQDMLAREICSRFGYADVDVMAWTAAELTEALEAVPQAWQSYDTSLLHFSFLKNGAGPASGGQNLDQYVVGKNVVYVYCPNGYGRTKLNNAYFEKLFGTRATTRNWNTTNKLLELVVS